MEKLISPHGIVDSRIGAIRIYACGDRYLRNRPAQRQGATLGVEGIEYGRWIRKLRSFSWGV